MSELNGKVAIVTGSSSGIGRAVAEGLARRGAAVVVHYANSDAKALAVVAGIEREARASGEGRRAIALQADIGRVADVRRLFAEAEERLGGIDILVNCAGVATYKPVVAVTEEDFAAIFDVNARGTFFSMQEGARRVRDGGRIINISTGGTVGGSPYASIYCGSKAAVEQFTKSLAKEIGSRNVTVNAVSPGFTDTEMLAANPDFKEMGARLSPFGRLGTPEEVAEVVLFLAGNGGRWVTGQNIQAGGGVA
jgi:3-oxoacyl-[acyl-carrier protein] reductase